MMDVGRPLRRLKCWMLKGANLIHLESSTLFRDSCCVVDDSMTKDKLVITRSGPGMPTAGGRLASK